MATERVINVKVKTGSAKKNVDDLNNSLDDTEKAAKSVADSVEEIADNTKDIKKSAKNAEDGVKGLSKGFGAMGTAIKAAGIGLLLSALGILRDLFDNNQRTVDFFNTTFNALQIAFSDFVKWIESNIGTFTGFFKDIFSNPLDAVKSLGEAIKNNIIERFNSLLEVLGFVGDALAKFFTGDFSGAMDSIKEAGKEMVDVWTGVDGSVDKLVEGTKNLVNGIADYTSNTIKAAQATTELNKNAEIAEVLAQGLIEKYDLQAERLRQTRDEERNTIEERIKANEELRDVLQKQEDEMMKNAQTLVAAKQRQLALDENNIEFQRELIQAQNELVGVQAQVAGFKSEQLMNEMALQRELLELERSKAETATEIFDIEQQAIVDTEMNLLKQLDLEEQFQMKRYQMRLADLESQRALYKEGTQAYQDAQNEIAILNAERTAEERAEAQKRADIEQQVQDLKVETVNNAFGAIMSLVDAFADGNEKQARRAFAINKALGIAQAIVNTANAVTKALAQTNDPTPTQSLRFANAAIAGVTGAAQIATISRQRFDSGSSGSSFSNISQPSLSAPAQAPSFNVVGGGENRLAEQIGQAINDRPVKTYVVSGDVTSAQELDALRVQGRSL